MMLPLPSAWDAWRAGRCPLPLASIPPSSHSQIKPWLLTTLRHYSTRSDSVTNVRFLDRARHSPSSRPWLRVGRLERVHAISARRPWPSLRPGLPKRSVWGTWRPWTNLCSKSGPLLTKPPSRHGRAKLKPHGSWPWQGQARWTSPGQQLLAWALPCSLG